MRKYEISSSTMRRIIQSPKTSAMKYIKTVITWYSELSSFETLMNFIESFIKITRTPFTWTDIWRIISEEFNIAVKPHVIRRVLKKDFALSYKKGSSRPTKLDEDRQMWLKSLFWLNLIQNFKNNIKILINVDGCVISNAIKQNYSWLSRGRSWAIFNSHYTGSMSLLSAISSDGSSFTAAYSSTVNAKVFIAFMEDLLKFHMNRSIEDPSQVWVIMDNVPYQKSKLVHEKLKDWRLNVLYLPPYTPEFAPIELLFRSIKAKLKMHREKQWLSLKSQNGIELVSAALRKIKQKEIWKYWSALFEQVKNCLHFIRNNW